MPEFAVGSLVRARGREWVVVPGFDLQMLLVRPLSGLEEETTGILLPLEPVEPAQFELPQPSQIGDHRSCRLLHDAVRFGFRSSAGPFRCFAQIAVEPRPYQLAPLLMALKLDPIRVLIADDVGIGKTIEACLLARELLDRGEVQRLAVLCPPHLAEQWQREIHEKFHIETELVLPGTAKRLERGCGVGQSLFDVHPHVVVSTDFIKSDRHRDDFLRACPELVIVDEAHSCAWGGAGRGGRHQRYELVKGLAANRDRHMILVTATPHSGHEGAFRTLLTFLDPSFADLPNDLTGPRNEHHRRRLAQHFIQRRRADIRHYMQADTPFPDRLEAEETYRLSPDYRKLFQRVLEYARERVRESGEQRHRQRVRWWSLLALLRSLASSPAAAASTLRSRAAVADTETLEEADEIGRRTVLDLEADETAEYLDITPGAECEEQDESDETKRNRRRLLDMAREADRLKGNLDNKLRDAIELVKGLLRDGARPILFCRFIPTAEYVAEELRTALRNVEVAAVTGTLPPPDRESRILELAKSEKRVLVCTDCLSEGINLQDHFDAVMHYDLSWNPTRHEQREGRVDRFGQPEPKVRVLTYYGIDNMIDGIVLDVLLRKHNTIRNSLGVSVPVPADTNQVMEAILEGLLLREDRGFDVGEQLDLFSDFCKDKKESLHAEWDEASKREKRSRTVFAQETLKVEEAAVAAELPTIRAAIGSAADVSRFVQESLRLTGAVVNQSGPTCTFDISEVPRSLRDALGEGTSLDRTTFKARFEKPVQEGELYLHRTHPLVENLANYVMNTALDPDSSEAIARRAGVIRTRAVQRRTTLLLARFRYHIVTERPHETTTLLAEDCQLLAFAGAPHSAEWLDSPTAEALLQAEPAGNIAPEQAAEFIQGIVANFAALWPHIEEAARKRGDELLDAHRRVRQAAQIRHVRYRVEPKLPPDILGIYVYLPAPEAH